MTEPNGLAIILPARTHPHRNGVNRVGAVPDGSIGPCGWWVRSRRNAWCPVAPEPCARSVAWVECQLSAVEVEMLGRVVIHVGQGHDIGEERVPAGWEAHAAS